MTKLLGFRSPQNRDILLSLLVLFASFSPCSAQVAHRRRRSSRSRIIAGVVVGVVALLGLLFLCCMVMKRRRRAAKSSSVLPTQLVGVPNHHSNPYTGGVAAHSQPQQSHTGQTAGTGQPIPMSSYDAGHSTPAAAAAAAPPPYPGVGDKTQNTEAGNTFAPPPGPPPPAHTAHDNQFVGGFRS
jgi:hypothetical protein